MERSGFAMKVQKSLAMFLALLMLAMSSAYAHGSRGRVGVFFGPVWGPAFYPPPYYYPPPIVVVPAAPPPVYIEQQEAPPEPPAAQQYWHYCSAAKGYYPYVKACPGGWQKVLPQPEQ